MPFAVETIHLIEALNPIQVEVYWHWRFADKRTNGEWFALTDHHVAEAINYRAFDRKLFG